MKTLSAIFVTVCSCILSLFLLTGCVHDDDYQTPSVKFKELPVNYTISGLKEEAGKTSVLFKNDSIIEGYVVSSDEGGNIYNNLHIVTPDGKTGVQLNINKSGIYNFYPVGKKVFVKLQGLYLAEQHDMTQIGGQPNNYSVVGPADWNTMVNHIFLSEARMNEDRLTQKFTGIGEVIKNENLNTLIEIDGVQFQDQYIGGTYYDSDKTSGSSMDNIIEDKQGKTLVVRVSQYSRLAGNEVATGSGKIKGILTKYGTVWQFMVRTVHDISMTEDRFTKEIKGSKESPYLVSEGISMQNQSLAGWIKGYIVGAVVNNYGVMSVQSDEDVVWGTAGIRATSVLIADSPDVKDYTHCIIVNLPAGAIRNSVNLVDHPENLEKELLIKGELKTYFGIPGLREVTEYSLK